jgi:hypothetical protein
MNAELEEIEVVETTTPQTTVATASPWIGSEEGWDLWVEEVCAAVLKCSAADQPPVSFQQYLQACLCDG